MNRGIKLFLCHLTLILVQAIRSQFRKRIPEKKNK